MGMSARWARRCRQGLPLGGLRVETFLLRRRCGTPIWPERVEPAFEASLGRLGLNYLDLYLIHTPFAFQPGDEQDPRDAEGNVVYDRGVTLLDTWRAMESLVDGGKCRAIGLSDIGLDEVKAIYEAARIKPAVVQVESHPYLPEWELLEFCKEKGVVLLAFAPLGHGMKPGLLEDPSDFGDRGASGKDAGAGAAGLGGAARHGFAYHAQDCGPREREFRHLARCLQTRLRRLIESRSGRG